MKLAQLQEARYAYPNYVSLIVELINTPLQKVQSLGGYTSTQNFHRRDFSRDLHDEIYKQISEMYGDPEHESNLQNGATLKSWTTYTPGHPVSSSWTINLNAWGDKCAIEVSRT